MVGFTLREVRSVDTHVYDVVLASVDREVVFKMVVDEGPITLLDPGGDFVFFVKSDPRELTPIYEAVLKFHDATRVDVVSSEE